MVRCVVARSIAAALCVMACRFSPNMAVSSDSIDAPADVAGDARHDGTPDTRSADAPKLLMNGSACGGAVWHADFSVDPTTIDLNGDGIDDFAVRGGGPLPGSLGSGLWTVPANSAALDTQPKQPFTTRVVIDVTMQDVTRGSGDHSTVCWINTAYTSTAFAPLFIDARRDSDEATSQTISIYGKMGSNAVESSIDAFSFGDNNLHHYHLDIDPSALTYDLVVDGSMDRGSKAYYSIALNGNDDQWATVQALGGDSVFDDFQVEVCP